MDAVAFENIVKTYRNGFLGRAGIEAVRDVSLSIPQGSVFGLLGPNRAGKTTLVKMLLSLSKPTSGNVVRFGEAAKRRRTLTRVGYMHENHAFPRYLTAREVLVFYGGLSGMRTSELAPRANILLERVGLADRGGEPITRFSKGMVQRLGLAQALMNAPDLLILDEPTEGLDLFGRQLLRDIANEYRSEGKTILLVTHVLNEVEELCDELAVLVSGKVAYRGSLKQLLGTGDKRPTLEQALRNLYEKGASE